MIIVPTIRNTGSRFVLHMLGVPVPRQADLLTWRGSNRATEDSIIFDHIFPHQKHIFLPLIRDHLTIVPLRHPYLTAKSWDDRGHDKADLVAMWRVLVTDIDPLNPYYLPLDVDNRADYLENIIENTGLPLETDWTPQGSKHGNHELRYQDVFPNPDMDELVDEIGDFLNRFYA
jgi:hypothetical protein